jgi:class 3 adenylate cyclase/tetratricopeptide (TPR) repeat protein
MHCPSCHTDNPVDASFCEQCGTKLELVCPACKTALTPGARFCKKCGTAIATPSAASLKKSNDSLIRVTEDPVAEHVDGERKTVTALFADIKGSMDLMENLDPEEARAIVDPALKLMMDAVHRYEGYVAQSTGDGIFALFGAQVAHEDHPQRALHAARRMQEELKRYADKLRERGQPPLLVRVGVNSGEVVVRSIQTDDAHTEYTPISHSVSLASRLQTLAAPGSVVIGESVRKFVEGYFELKALGATRIRGVSEPVNIYEVIGLGPLRTRLQRSAGRGLTKFVGREREMEALRHAADLAGSGHGQIVTAMAEPGVGKSRLFYEFKAVARSGWMVLEGFSVSHGKASAYLPVIDLLHSYFGIEAGDDGRKRREKVAGRITILDRALEDTLPYLFGLLSILESDDLLAQMDGHVKKRRTLEAIKRILLRESLNQPLMVIVEDLHWIDEETQDFLNLLADSIGTAKILLLVNYRPEYSHSWGSKTYYTQLRLDPLGKESAEEMLAALLGDVSELAALKRLIIEKTEGTPFFMEETVQVLLDDGSLERNGAVHLTKPLAELKIPPTVQAILASRIDRLAADGKELLQTLSVVGREFPLSLVRVLALKSDDELNRLLNDLQLGEFIYEQPAVSDTEYIFKHAFTREVAYNSVLMERRKFLHERIGEMLESTFAAQLDGHLDELAHHYSRSSNLGKAIKYLTLAGARAYRRSDLSEAVRQQGLALELLGARASADSVRRRNECELLLAYGTTLGDLGRANDAISTLERALKLAEDLLDEPTMMQVLSALRLVMLTVRGPRDALPIANRLLNLTADSKDSHSAALGHSSVGGVLYYLCELPRALYHFERVIELDRPTKTSGGKRPGDPRARALGYSAQTLWHLGYPDQASERVKYSLAAADTELAAPDATWLYYRAFTVYRWLGNIALVRESVRKASAIAADRGLSAHAVTLIIDGWTLAASGESRQGIEEIKRGIAEWHESGRATFVESFEILADACLIGAELEEGFRTVSEGLELLERSGDVLYEAALYRLLGELLARTDADERAEAAFRNSIGIANQRSLKSWELRASMSLTRLLAKQRRRDEARTMLADIYGSFTEGFDTADLKEAKALLEQPSE